ncbi:bifunctional tRNA (5-methylaminomethyl-2-thiouridine)(34)-methyltransferase MnmD/FAD-dependent 5-carboxymethylaminomethyl-2-thiouridine(34) oxidoreductase MnmC [Hyphococcus sp.]|uniref:bifunctional tRNA (5-methylaminomethyl-2-thiouridine)(34)-methyltransferase MnmD/FAD-dependent 5-carboxymethylaminomethyl-2-thiouridine(34) oxidoreductase MnmC n=1 Tax=Hyphococcus sp. TaxID=2038636 RepID=UPI00208826AB|nr:MAG: tRNA 5-methylaminomethyl-2-thiouridine biosynthesis bifunctional protein MnmC [Marinicaulis sp.]
MNGGGIDEAKLDWGALPENRDAPRSVLFDDVYFSGDGPAETAHVFLAGNDLPSRFKTPRFHIGELGFGTGLNFLCAWNMWRNTDKPVGAKLHFFSVEGFPFAARQLARAHLAWPELDVLSAQLRTKMPPPHPGLHHIDFGDVALMLFYGEALDSLTRTEALIDAWFLDGFSPAKNPAMWSPEIFAELARLSNDDATFATFTVAGGVRKVLERAGFEWEKRPGFGRKKEMLAGRIAAPSRTTKRAPWFMPAKPLDPGARIAIIGAGIAGASLAHSLTHAGFNPVVYESAAPAYGASGNPAGLIMPRLDLGETPTGDFHANAYLHSVRLLPELGAEAFNPCGVVHHATNEKERERQQKLVSQRALPDGWIEQCNEGLFFPQAGVVDPAAFVAALLADTTAVNERVTRLDQTPSGWRVITAQSQTGFDAVIIANGLDALRLGQARTLPLSGSAGQIDWFPDATPPEAAHAFGPYAAPAPKGGAIIGATYAPIAIGAEARFTKEATQSNIAAIARTMPDFAATLDPAQSRPRAAIRCTTPDRLPVAGPLPDWGFYSGAYDDLRTGKRQDYPAGELRPGLFILSGLGSRGLVTAPYAAALLAAELSGAATDSTFLQALHPARFFIRDLKRASMQKSRAR